MLTCGLPPDGCVEESGELVFGPRADDYVRWEAGLGSGGRGWSTNCLWGIDIHGVVDRILGWGAAARRCDRKAAAAGSPARPHPPWCMAGKCAIAFGNAGASCSREGLLHVRNAHDCLG